MLENINCELSEPIKETPESEFWQFSKMNCEVTEQHGFLVKPDGQENEFFVDKSISYGELLFFTCFFLWFLFYIFKSIWGFVVPKSVKYLAKNDL